MRYQQTPTFLLFDGSDEIDPVVLSRTLLRYEQPKLVDMSGYTGEDWHVWVILDRRSPWTKSQLLVEFNKRNGEGS